MAMSFRSATPAGNPEQHNQARSWSPRRLGPQRPGSSP